MLPGMHRNRMLLVDPSGTATERHSASYMVNAPSSAIPASARHSGAISATPLTDFLQRYGGANGLPAASTPRQSPTIVHTVSDVSRLLPRGFPAPQWSSSQVPVNRHTEKHRQVMQRHRQHVEEKYERTRMLNGARDPMASSGALTQREQRSSAHRHQAGSPKHSRGPLTSRPSSSRRVGSARKSETVIIFSAEGEWSAQVSAAAGIQRQDPYPAVCSRGSPFSLLPLR